MAIQIFRKQSIATKNWSGGTTTELFIYPAGSSYAERDFLLRISTATVESSPSTFTLLPGVQRQLMVLDGELVLDFGDRQQVLPPFEVLAFSGDTPITSIGLATDFNAMTRTGAEASIRVMRVAAAEEVNVASSDLKLIYVFRGCLSLPDSTLVHTGDVLCIDPNTALSLRATEDTLLIITEAAFI